METATNNSAARAIIDDLEVMKPTVNRYAQKLAELGIEVREYPLITDDAILQFVTKRLASMKLPWRFSVKTFGFDTRYGWSGCAGVERQYITYRRGLFGKKLSTDPTHDMEYKITWLERDLNTYPGFMPEHVLDAAIKAKAAGYQDLRVVTIDEQRSVVPPYVDPLLIAYKNKRRYLIDYWDKDIDPTEITMS